MAMTEAEPSMVANDVQTSLAPIRAIQHRDNQGIPIADPDRSNPTRSRWERPLDTIRSFEAAIDDLAEGAATYNRRSSYYAGSQVPEERSRHPQNSYYGGRAQSYRPESTHDGRPGGMNRPDSYYNNQGDNVGPSNGYYPNRARYPRTASEPHFGNGQGVYPVPGNQQSYETVTTASGSGGSSADPAGYSTDPSSENSSMDRIAPPPKDPGETYGFNGFGNTPQYLPPGSSLNEQYGSNGAQRQGDGYMNPPPLPRKESGPPRVPIKLGASSGNVLSKEARPPTEKRKSWFGKRFSKNG